MFQRTDLMEVKYGNYVLYGHISYATFVATHIHDVSDNLYITLSPKDHPVSVPKTDMFANMSIRIFEDGSLVAETLTKLVHAAYPGDDPEETIDLALSKYTSSLANAVMEQIISGEESGELTSEEIDVMVKSSLDELLMLSPDYLAYRAALEYDVHEPIVEESPAEEIEKSNS